MFIDELYNLAEKIELAIKEEVRKKGIESDNGVVIKVDSDFLKFNLGGDRHLVEVSEDNLIDNEGYTYNYETLNTNDLAELGDYICN